jgi:hypothetical protein
VADGGCVTTGGCEGDAHAASGLGDACADLEHPNAKGGELGLGQAMGFGHGDAHSQHQRKRWFITLSHAVDV